MPGTSLTDILTPSILHLPVACIISRASTTEIVAVNDAAAALFGYPNRAEMLTLDVTSITAPVNRPDLRDNYSAVFAEGLTTVKRYRRADGSEFTGQLFARPMVGHTDVAIAVVIDLEQADELRAGD